MKTFKIAVVGATGAVGRQMLCELAEFSGSYNFNVELYASSRSAGQRFSFRGEELEVYDLNSANDRGPWDYVLMSAGAQVAQSAAALFTAQGAVVIDNSRAYRGSHLLIVPEVNGSLLSKVRGGDIIANPNCSTIQLVVCLKSLQEAFGLKKVHVATYQAVSGAGEKGQRSLRSELAGEAYESCFSSKIAGNLIPQIGEIDSHGHCEEEVKMVQETQKILQQPDLEVQVMTVRVPVENSHSEAVFVELDKNVSRDDILDVWRKEPCLQLCEDGMDLPDPLMVSGCAEVFVGRVRLPYGVERSRSVQFWNVADNLRKGAATNAVQILLKLLELRS